MRGRLAVIKPTANAMTKAPPPPRTLPRSAHPEWKRTVGDLIARGLLVEAMLGPVESYCVASWQRGELVKALERDGQFIRGKSKQIRPHPAHGLLNKNQELITRLSAELGLTAAARSRKALRVEEGNRGEEEQDSAWSEVDL